MRPIKERVFRRIFRLSRYHAWLVLIGVLLLTGATTYYVRNIPIRSSFLALLPQNDPLVNEYRHTEESLLQTDYLALLVTLQNPDELSSAERRKKLLAAAEAISKQVKADPGFSSVTYLQEPAPEIPDQYLVLYRLDKQELSQIEQSITLAQQSIASGESSALPKVDLTNAYQQVGQAFDQALSNGGLGGGGSGTAAIETQLDGVSNLNQAVLGTIDGINNLPAVTSAVQDLTRIFAPSQAEVTRSPEPYLSPDNTRLLMTVQPVYPSERGVSYCTTVMKSLRGDLGGVDLASLGVTVGVTGTYAYNDETNSVINRDMERTTIISSVGVLVIFFLAFGSISYSLIALIPLLVSVVLTMGWAKIAVGGFNLLTTFLPALVLGLGIDYAIHLISRYSEERRRGVSLNRALYIAILRKGDASFVAAVTTALVFLGLLFSHSRALFEMGVITSMGVLIAFAVTLVLLPALLTLLHFVFRVRHREGAINYAPHLARFFHGVTSKGRAIFVIILILTFFILFQAAQTRFIFASTDMVPRVKSQDVLADIQKHFGASSAALGDSFVFFASDEQALSTVVSKLKSNSLVTQVDSALQLLPVNLSEQQKVLNNLNIPAYIAQLDLLDKSLADRASAQTQIRTLLTQFGLLQYVAALNGEVDVALLGSKIQQELLTVQNRLRELDVATARGRVEALRDALTTFDQDLAQVRDLPSVETLLRDILKGLPEGIAARFMAPNGDYIVRAWIAPAIYNGDNLQQFDAFAASFSDHYFGMPLVAKQLEMYMKRDFLVSTLLALLLITITLWRSLGGWVRTVLAASPLLLGYIWMLGGMRLLQIDFNFINITISPLLIGVGVDNGIHILHRYREERELDPQGALERGSQKTAVAVIITSLTTMLVFASLLFARTPGLRILGISALLGLGFTLLFSLVFLPAALHVEGGKRV